MGFKIKRSEAIIDLSAGRGHFKRANNSVVSIQIEIM